MRVIALLGALSLAACAAAPEPPALSPGEARQAETLYNPVDRIGTEPGPLTGAAHAAAMLEGRWSNEDQYAAAPEDLKRPPAPGHPYDWLDLQQADFFTIDAPGIGDFVTYLEWRGADGAISRQRVWAFREDGEGALTGMDFYSFADGAPWAGRGAEPGAFTALSPDDLIGYPEGCTLEVRRPAWAGYVLEADPEVCLITARSGRTMGIRARIELSPHHVSYAEAGVLEDGRYAFLVPGGPAYEFRRVEAD
ncbi:MAG: CpcT/CpeT family chromophore lyase [Oceanicaulis sp.]